MAKLIAGIEKPESGRILFDRAGYYRTEHHGAGEAGHQLRASSSRCVFKGIHGAGSDRPGGKEAKCLSQADACEYLVGGGAMRRQDYIDREVNASLSGGEFKRIEIATVVGAAGRSCLIFDEPEAGIDLWSFQQSDRCF